MLRLLRRLFLLAIPLLLFPRLLAFLAQSNNDPSFNLASSHKKGQHYDDLTPLEKLLAQQLGWGCVGVAVVLACIVSFRLSLHAFRCTYQAPAPLIRITS